MYLVRPRRLPSGFRVAEQKKRREESRRDQTSEQDV